MLNGVLQAAFALADAGSEDRFAGLADRSLAGDARDLLGSPVERRDSPVSINREHAICDRVENDVLDLAVSAVIGMSTSYYQSPLLHSIVV